MCMYTVGTPVFLIIINQQFNTKENHTCSDVFKFDVHNVLSIHVYLLTKTK